MKQFAIILLLIIGFNRFTYAQQSDTTSIVLDTVKLHSPKKATLMSLALPGLGQAYNKKYWKIPIVYALIGTSLYFAIDQQNQFDEFKGAYLKRVDDDPTTIDAKYDGVYTNENLLSLIDYHRKNRDLFFLLTGVAYALNVVDAAVDAHLYYFEVDEISGTIKPSFQYDAQQFLVPSLTLSLKFGKNSNSKPISPIM